MKRFLVLLLLLSVAYLTEAQMGHSIRYKRTWLDHERTMEERLVFNDSFAFSYIYIGRDPLKKATVFWKKVINHARFSNRKSKTFYDEVKLLGRSKKMLIRDSSRIQRWMPAPGSKNILGYECKNIKRVAPGGQEISIWYTSELGEGIVFDNYGLLPGIPLLITDNQYQWVIKALDLSEGQFNFVLPDVPIVSRKEYFERIQNQ